MYSLKEKSEEIMSLFLKVKSTSSAVVGGQSLSFGFAQDKPETVPVIVNDKGGIDLSQIELALQDEKLASSSLNPADIKILLAAKALKKDNWDSLALLRIHEVIGFLRDGIIQNIENRELLLQVLEQLKIKALLDPQALQFLQFLQSQKPIPEIKLALK